MPSASQRRDHPSPHQAHAYGLAMDLAADTDGGAPPEEALLEAIASGCAELGNTEELYSTIARTLHSERYGRELRAGSRTAPPRYYLPFSDAGSQKIRLERHERSLEREWTLDQDYGVWSQHARLEGATGQ